jgi:sugar diacid utilization regulator
MSEEDAKIILAIANCNMVKNKASKELHYHRNSLYLKVQKIKKSTGLDPYNFYDLIHLVEIAKKEVQHDKS